MFSKNCQSQDYNIKKTFRFFFKSLFYIFISTIPIIINTAADSFFIKFFLSFWNRYPTITFSIIVKLQSGAINDISPCLNASSFNINMNELDIPVINISILFELFNSFFIVLIFIFSNNIISIDGTISVIAT